MYNEKYPKAKIKSYNGKINTNFYNDKIPKEDSQFICLSVILIDSVFRTSKNYYPQLFLEECKYVIKEKISEYITDNIEISSSSETEVDFSIIRFYFSFWIFLLYADSLSNSFLILFLTFIQISFLLFLKQKILMKKILMSKIVMKKVLKKKN